VGPQVTAFAAPKALHQEDGRQDEEQGARYQGLKAPDWRHGARAPAVCYAVCARGGVDCGEDKFCDDTGLVIVPCCSSPNLLVLKREVSLERMNGVYEVMRRPNRHDDDALRLMIDIKSVSTSTLDLAIPFLARGGVSAWRTPAKC